MQPETRRVKYDPELKVEAYSFMGIMQKFPTTFMTITLSALLKAENAPVVKNRNT